MQSMTNFEKWAKGKHPLLAVVAHSLVIQSRPAYGITKAIYEEDMLLGDVPAPDLDTWLKLFRSHPSLTDYMLKEFGDPTGLFRASDDLFEQFDDHVPITYTDIPLNDAQNLFDQYLITAQTIDDEYEQTVSVEQLEKMFLSPEFYFFFRVYMPCWFAHSTTPAQLLRKARLRDFDSLTKLIKLDPSAMFDKKISHYVHNLRSTNRSRYEQILNALQNKSKSKMTRQKFKIFFAAIISHISHEFGERLTEPEIRGLFDAVSQDEGRGEIDVDLPDSPHTFYMGMKRHIATSK